MIEIRIIEDLNEFDRIQPAWDELLATTDVDHAFMRHRWFTEWVKAYEWGDRLSIITIWSDKQLMAAAPIGRTEFFFRGIKSEGLSFLWSPVAPRCNVIAADTEFCKPLTEQILKLPDWDIFAAKNMETDLKITDAFVGCLRDRRPAPCFHIEDGFQSPYMLTEGSFREYWDSLPEKRRRHLERMCIRRLKKAGKSRISRVATSEQFLRFRPTMFEISRRSWKSITQDHLDPNTPEGRFYANFTPNAIDRGLVTLYTLEIDGTVVGFEYLLSCNRKYALIRCDYDERFKYYSPGNNLRLAVIEDLFGQDHACEYDLGGDAYDYKLQWCGNIRKHSTVIVGSDSLRGKSIMFAKSRIMPSLRRIGIELPRRKKR